MKRIELGTMPKSFNPDVVNISDSDGSGFRMTINDKEVKNISNYSFGNDSTFRTLTITIIEPVISINAE